MAEKNKNSQLNIHYSRTMTSDNLSKAANYVGEYILKGLGAFGKIMTTPLTGGPLGTTSVVLPKTKELLDAERKIRETQELLIGRASTWLSPLNYGAALTTGNGLNARKGEEEVASWSPAWQAIGRLGELYVGPKAVKGASRVAINTAARAGVKPAKAAVIAREINKGVNKNTPKYDNRIHSIRVDNLIYDYSSNPLLEFVNTIKTSPTNSYFMRAPSKIDITKLHNGRFRHEVVGNNILSSGEVNGKFVSYGEPWKEFGFDEGSALYEFPVGPKRGPNMMATDWKGRNKDYSVNEAYDYMKLEELLRKDLRLLNKQMGELFDKNYATIRNNLIEAKYPLLKLHIDTSIHGGNQTVIPNLKWNFNNFLNSPFYKYTIDPISNQVQKELVISGVPNKPVEPSTSLAFFERNPSKISEAERAGVPKGDRNLPFKSKLPTEHVQGDKAVKMFKEYGGEPIPEGSINGELLRKYVAEARERYGLTNNKNITDEEIAQALYKHSKELGGNTAAVNAQGEPQLLFRGDTRRYTQLKERISPEELATKSGTMDNSLGNLFLGELSGTAGKHTRGLERYLVTGNEFLEKRLEGSGTGSRAVMPDGTFATEWGSTISEFPEGSYHLVTYNTKHGPNTYYKLPSSYSESGVNDINAFVVRTPQVRDASREISVLNDDFMVKGGPKVEYHGPIRKEILDKDGFPLIVDEKGNVVADGLAGSSDRQAMALHYRYVLNDAKNKKQGLLKSNGETDGTPGNYLRDEHDDYTYFALPNFNIQGAKHLLPYDLRIPRNWKDKNIYRGLIPLTTGYTLYNIFNQPLQQLQYLKHGGKMNILEFLKKGSGIHIKPSKRGSFTRWCGGNVTEECIRKGKNSPNAAIRKKATFVDNARHFKHKKGGKAFVEGVNVLDSNPKMSKAASKRVKKHLYGGDINNPNAMGGAAFTSWINYQIRLPELLKLREERKQQELLLEQLKLIEKSEKLNSILGTVSNFGYLALGKLLNNKSVSKVDNPSTTNFWDTPTIKNSQVTGDFWNNPTIANSIA